HPSDTPRPRLPNEGRHETKSAWGTFPRRVNNIVNRGGPLGWGWASFLCNLLCKTLTPPRASQNRRPTAHRAAGERVNHLETLSGWPGGRGRGFVSRVGAGNEWRARSRARASAWDSSFPPPSVTPPATATQRRPAREEVPPAPRGRFWDRWGH